MKYGFLTAGCCGLVGLVSVVELVGAPKSEATAMPALPGFETYVVLFSSSDGTCLVQKAMEAGPVVKLIVDAECDTIQPGFSKARYWLNLQDDTVAFSITGHDLAISFALADGVAYESFQPKSPLISLIAGN